MEDSEPLHTLPFPNELLCEIFSYLSGRDLRSLSRSCTSLRSFIDIELSLSLDIMVQQGAFEDYVNYMVSSGRVSSIKSLKFISPGMMSSSIRTTCYSSFRSLSLLTSLSSFTVEVEGMVPDQMFIYQVMGSLPPSISSFELKGGVKYRERPPPSIVNIRSSELRSWTSLPSLSGLSSLSLINIGSIRASTVRSLATLNLKSLELGWSCEVGDKRYRTLYIMPLCLIPSITSLSFHHCHLTGDEKAKGGTVVQSLSYSKELRYLFLNSCSGIAQGEIRSFQRSNKLVCIKWINGNDINSRTPRDDGGGVNRSERRVIRLPDIEVGEDPETPISGAQSTVKGPISGGTTPKPFISKVRTIESGTCVGSYGATMIPIRTHNIRPYI